MGTTASTSGSLKDYKLTEELGRGGFGVVYAADHPTDDDGRKVAVKIIKSNEQSYFIFFTKDSNREMARKELKILAGLKHPGIIRFLNSFEDQFEGTKAVFIVTEFCRYGSLNHYLATFWFWPNERKRIQWCIWLAEALEYLHSEEFAHRDIKPANILVDGNRRLKLGDFGLAKSIQSALGYEHYMEMYMKTCAGTPFYLAPEVFDQHYTKACDIFSLGLVFLAIIELPPNHAAYLSPLVMTSSDKVATLGLHYKASKESRGKEALSLLSNHQPFIRRKWHSLLNSMMQYDYKKRPNIKQVLADLRA